MNSLASQIIIAIINREMRMGPEQVWLRDQNKLIPNDQGLYIVVGMISSNFIGAVTEAGGITDPADRYFETNQVYMEEIIQIDILSRSNDALMRNWEIIAALNSIYSKQQQELNFFKIFRASRSFINTSVAEGGSQLNKYSLTVPCFVWYRKSVDRPSVQGDFYKTFPGRVDDEKTIGTDSPLIDLSVS